MYSIGPINHAQSGEDKHIIIGCSHTHSCAYHDHTAYVLLMHIGYSTISPIKGCKGVCDRVSVTRVENLLRGTIVNRTYGIHKNLYV